MHMHRTIWHVHAVCTAIVYKLLVVKWLEPWIIYTTEGYILSMFELSVTVRVRDRMDFFPSLFFSCSPGLMPGSTFINTTISLAISRLGLW